MELTYTQVLLVERQLKEAGLHYVPLQEELLDHICCCIEAKMLIGLPFLEAMEDVFQAFGKKDLQNIQEQTVHFLNQKSKIMRQVAFGILASLLFTVTTIWAASQEPPSRSPLGEQFTITSNFGMRHHPIHKVKKMHKGIDFKAPTGTPVYATADGEVKNTKRQTKGQGNYIVLKHDEEYETFYAQLSDIKVKKGQVIKKGALIGLVGNSGISTAPHLHYEVRKEGKAVNPMDYLNP